MPALKNRPKKILKSYRLDQSIVDALSKAVSESKTPASETEIVCRCLKKGLGLK